MGHYFLSLEKDTSIVMLSAAFWMKYCLTEAGVGSLDEIDPGCPYAQDIRRRRVAMRKLVLTTQLRRLSCDTRQVSDRSHLDA